MVVCYLLPWPTQLVCPQRMLAVLEVWLLGLVGGGKIGGEDLCDPLGIRSEEKGRPQQVSSYRAGDETGGTGAQEQ